MKCRCTNVQKTVYRLDEEELTSEITTHLEACPACQKTFQQAIIVRKLVRLKRHELPDPGSEQRCVLQLHQQLVSLEQRLHQRERDEEANPLTGWRYGVAAAFVAVLAFNMLAAHQLPALRSSVAASSAFSPTPTLLQFASSNQQFRFDATSPFFLSPVAVSNNAHFIRRPQSQSVLTSFEE